MDLLFLCKSVNQTLGNAIVIDVLKNITYTGKIYVHSYHACIYMYNIGNCLTYIYTYTTVPDIDQHVCTGAVPDTKRILERKKYSCDE